MAAAAVATFGLAACGGGSGGGEQRPERRGHADVSPTTRTPRPPATTRCCTRRASSPSSARCTTRCSSPTPTVRSQPSLVTEFANSADNLQTTLTLRDDVTFTDGSSLDADLVKANLDRRDDQGLEAYGAVAAGGASEITDVTAPDPQTVVITWASPQATPESTLVDTAGRHRRSGRHRRPRTRWRPPPTARVPTPSTRRPRPGRAPTRSTKDDDAWNADSWALRHDRLLDHHRRAGAGQRGRLRAGRHRDRSWTPPTIDLVESRQCDRQRRRHHRRASR